jgi:DNA (cytosine-5)-methyltransferase 1
MTTYSGIKELLKFNADKMFTDEHAYITHYLQNPENESYREEAMHYIAARSDSFPAKNLKIKWDVPFPPPKNPEFRFIDLFAGIGGFRMAFQKLGGHCVFSSEWNPYAKKNLRSEFWGSSVRRYY